MFLERPVIPEEEEEEEMVTEQTSTTSQNRNLSVPKATLLPENQDPDLGELQPASWSTSWSKEGGSSSLVHGGAAEDQQMLRVPFGHL